MDGAKIDYILDIFRTLTTELPEQMLYRDNGDSIELRTLDDIGNGISPDNSWKLIRCQMTGAA